MKMNNVFTDSKKHYEILDGLRGVAALIVVLFHIFEIFSNGDHTKQFINHGYLAVDFFFVLSGFVIAHAYDDRWNKMTIAGFFKRRLIRLHPMIIVGMTIGAVAFYFSESPIFPNIAGTPLWKLILVMLIGYTLLPLPVSMDIRGWTEMHPLNGPSWSLFFEYIANILYALILRKLSNIILIILTVLAGLCLIYLGITSPKGDIIGGWSLTSEQLRIGFTRLMYPFLSGLILSRLFKPGNIKNAFLWCTLLIIFFLGFPRVGADKALWWNGLYDSLTVIIVFPLIVYIGASGKIKSEIASKICTFLGDISYPIYIVHFPLIYIFYAWVVNNKVSLDNAWPMGIVVLIFSVLIAYISLKFYDLPFRKWLTRKINR